MNGGSGFRILKNLTLGGALRFSLLVLLVSCSGTGYQGGRIPTNFKGIKTIQAVSPDEIEITWEPFPGAVDYKIYTPTSNNAIATIPGGISKYQFNPASLGIAKTDLGYTFSVTVTNPLTRSEEGSRSAYASVTLLPRFNFKQSSSTLSPIPNQPSLRLTWQAFPAVLYKIYYLNVIERLSNQFRNINR